MSKLIRETVLRSLSAVGAIDEASFYADLFFSQKAEQFALIVIDPRCLKNPLLEALISNLKILFDLGLSPVLLIGALDHDPTSVRFQAHRLSKDLENASVKVSKLDTASYQLIPEVRKTARKGVITILEMVQHQGKMNLKTLATKLQTRKVIFLQPSGGITINNRRLSTLNLDHLERKSISDSLTPGQKRFVAMVKDLSANNNAQAVYVIVSPLNLLRELFTTKGSGTLIRRAAPIDTIKTMKQLDHTRLKLSLEDAFEKPISSQFFKQKIYKGYIETEYRGGAIFRNLESLPYLSKFWVTREAQGEGIARDIWDRMVNDIPAFFWRSRMGNPFNDWYMRTCDGMQIKGDWRVFWKGLKTEDVAGAIAAAAAASDDFLKL